MCKQLVVYVMVSIFLFASTSAYSWAADVVFSYSGEKSDDDVTFSSEDEAFSKAVNAGFTLAKSSIAERGQEFVDGIQRGIHCGKIILATGDSWLRYPGKADLVQELARLQWAVYSSADYGDTLEDMLYNKGQLWPIRVRLSNLQKYNEEAPFPENRMKECELSNAYNNRFPKAILISAGGNDLIVSALRYMMEYEASSYDGTINSAFLDAMVGRLGRMMTEYISALIMICNATLSRADCTQYPNISSRLRLR